MRKINPGLPLHTALKTLQTSFILTEGGRAVERNLQNKFSDPKPIYTPITVNDDAFEAIQALLGIVSKYKDPTKEINYNLGSSRLFFTSIPGLPVKLYPGEQEKDIEAAKQKKIEYGDLDLGIPFKREIQIQQLIEELNNHPTDRFKALHHGSEIHVAVRLKSDPTKIIQIDLIDSNKLTDDLDFSKNSSFLDMAQGIKGNVSVLFIRSLVAAAKINDQLKEQLEQAIKNSEAYRIFQKKRGPNGGFHLRYSLGQNKVQIIIDWFVIDEKTKEKKKISFTYKGRPAKKLDTILDEHIFNKFKKFIEIPFTNLNKIAEIIGLQSESSVRHAIQAAKECSSLPEEQKKIIWTEFLRRIKELMETFTRSGLSFRSNARERAQIKQAVQVLANVFDPPFQSNTFTDINLFEQRLLSKNASESFRLVTEQLKVSKMSSIPYLHKLPLKELQSLLRNLDSIEFTEKVDGNNFSLGVTDGKFFVKTKRGTAVTDPTEFDEIYKQTGIKEFLRFKTAYLALNKPTIVNWLKQNQVQIFGELFTEAAMNIIAYDKTKIGDGTLYLFGIKNNDGVELVRTEQGKKLLAEFKSIAEQAVPNWKFYLTYVIPEIKVDETLVQQLQQELDKNAFLLQSRKRGDKEAKEQVKLKIDDISTQLRDKLVDQLKQKPSALGAQSMEGVVVTWEDPPGSWHAAKIVMADFQEDRNTLWSTRNTANEIVTNVLKTIHKTIFNEADILILKSKRKQKIIEYIDKTGKKLKTEEDILKALYEDIANESNIKQQSLDQIKHKLLEILDDAEQQLQTLLQNEQLQETDIEQIKHKIKQIQDWREQSLQKINKMELLLYLIKLLLGPKQLQILLQQINI